MFGPAQCYAFFCFIECSVRTNGPPCSRSPSRRHVVRCFRLAIILRTTHSQPGGSDWCRALDESSPSEQVARDEVEQHVAVHLVVAIGLLVPVCWQAAGERCPRASGPPRPRPRDWHVLHLHHKERLQCLRLTMREEVAASEFKTWSKKTPFCRSPSNACMRSLR